MVIAEGWMVATSASETIESESVRDQVARLDKDRGAIYRPWMVSWNVGRERGKASPIVQLMGEKLADIGLMIDGDVPRWGEVHVEGREGNNGV